MSPKKVFDEIKMHFYTSILNPFNIQYGKMRSSFVYQILMATLRKSFWAKLLGKF